jgi:DNA-binding MarR family transcriptional regulator
MSSAIDRLRKRREQMLLRLLLRLTRAMNDETTGRVQALGFVLQPSYPRLLGNLEAGGSGTRIAALARRMGTTRQAVSQLVQEIEDKGYVERRPDPDDKRGVVIHFTPRGRKMLAHAMRVMKKIEAEYALVLGEGGLEKLKQLLSKLADAVDPAGTLGLD